MLNHDRDPIVAVATAPGRGAVGIVRISGQGLLPLAHALLGRTPQARQAHYGPFLDAAGQALDQGLALYFPAPHSFTGEDVLELQAHGGPVLLQLLVQRCLEASTCLGAARLRLAEPGEFSRRAFLNGKMDLAQAEAVADLIEAGTERAARSAVRSLQGEFSKQIDALAQRVLHLRMLVEATLDFPEEDIDFLEQADARGQVAALRQTLQQVLLQTRQGALLREGMRVVIAGQPNVGKSSLLNALAGQEVAIVTPIAGTTRDRIEQVLQIDGVPLHVIDTAGLRSEDAASDDVERIGIARSWEAIRQADAVLLLADGSRIGQDDYDAADAQIRQQLQAHGVPQDRWLLATNKADLDTGSALKTHADIGDSDASGTGLRLSAKTGEGLEALRRALLHRAGWQDLPEGVALARTRHVEALRRCAQHLERAHEEAQAATPAIDLFAEELRLAHHALGEITGQVSADELLGVIFSSFCIGK